MSFTHKCPRCGSTEIYFGIRWGKKYKICSECGYKEKVETIKKKKKEEEKKFYIEEDWDESKKGLLEIISEHL